MKQHDIVLTLSPEDAHLLAISLPTGTDPVVSSLKSALYARLQQNEEWLEKTKRHGNYNTCHWEDARFAFFADVRK